MKRIFIKIGAKTIYFINNFKFKNSKSTKQDINPEYHKIEKKSLDEIIEEQHNKKKDKKIDKKFLILIPLIILIFTHNMELILEISGILLIISLYIKFLPKIKNDKRKQDILKNLPYGLRQLSTQLKAGIGLYDSMKTISNSNYGTLSEEFTITLREIQYGINYVEAFNNLSERTEIPILDKVISQIIRTLNNGGNLADTLNSIANENSYNLKLKYKEYSQKLNAIMLIYMFIAVLLPVISFIMIIAATTVMGSIIEGELLLVLYLVFFPMIIAFMILFIKRMEPTI